MPKLKIFDEDNDALTDGEQLELEIKRGEEALLFFVKDVEEKKKYIKKHISRKVLRDPELESSDEPMEAYDVVGPICESSDVFAKQIDLNGACRGDLMAIRSAGAYGEIMASQYNCRKLPIGYMSDEI